MSPFVQRFRRLALNHGRWAALLFCLALSLRILMPTGFMPVATGKALTVELCTGTGPASLVLHVPAAPGKDRDQGKPADQPCSFSALGIQSLAAADPVLLGAALLFAFLLALLVPESAPVRDAAHLRPPLRGPPALV